MYRTFLCVHFPDISPLFKNCSRLFCYLNLHFYRLRLGGGPLGGGPLEDEGGPLLWSLGRLAGGPMSRDEGGGRRMGASRRSSLRGGPLGGPPRGPGVK